MKKLIKPLTVFAASTSTVDIQKEIGSFFGYECIGPFISNIVDLFIIVAAVALLILLVMGGMEWLLSSGDKVKLESAQKRITNAIIGLLIVATSWAIWQLIIYFFGIDLDALCTQNPV